MKKLYIYRKIIAIHGDEMDVSLEFMGFIVIHRDLAKKHGNIHPPTHLNLGDPNTHGYGLNH